MVQASDEEHIMQNKSSALRTTRLMAVGAIVCALGIVALTVLQYLMPYQFDANWGLNNQAVRHFQRVLFGGVFPELISDSVFAWCFRTLLILAWGGYGLALYTGSKGGTLNRKLVLVVVTFVVLFTAVLWPLSLSRDCYAYAGYARLNVLHGLNPYVHTQRELADLHDPIAGVLMWDIPSPYGPVWTQLSFLIVALLRSAAIWWQVVLLKLVQALALIAAAFTGRWIAERFRCGWGNLTFLAIGLNPLFLIEGPGNGHNDMLMMSLLLICAVFVMSKRYALGYLALGLSAGVKFATGLALPWILMEHCRGMRLTKCVLPVTTALVLVLLPTTLSFCNLWHGPSTLSGLVQSVSWGHSSNPDPTKPVRWIKPEVPTQQVNIKDQFIKHLPLLLAYVLLTAWLVKRGTSGSWLEGWSILSGIFILLSIGMWFPWYFIWAWMSSLTRWDKPSLNISFIYFGIAVFFTMLYTVQIAPTQVVAH